MRYIIFFMDTGLCSEAEKASFAPTHVKPDFVEEHALKESILFLNILLCFQTVSTS